MSLFSIPLAALVFVLPAILLGPAGSDAVYHWTWYEHFSRQLWQGDLYPRWLYDMNAGCGSPTFFYYPPLPYYIASLFAFLNHLEPAYWQPMVATAYLVLCGGALAVYAWLKPVTSHVSALAASLIYLFLPYTSAVFYGGFMYSFLFSFFWAPVFMILLRRVRDDHLEAVLWLALAHAGLLLSTVPGFIILAPLPFVYWILQGNWRLRHFLRLCLAALMGAGLSAIYWLPMVTLLPEAYIGHTNILWEDVLHYKNNFFFTATYASLGEGMVLTMLSTTVLLVGGYAMFRTLLPLRETLASADWKYCFILLCVVFFLLLPFSEFIWEWVVPLQLIQHPQRLQAIFSLCCSCLCAFFFETRIRKQGKEKTLWEIAIVAAGILPAMFGSYAFHIHYTSSLPSYEGADFYLSRMRFYPYDAVPTWEHIPMGVDTHYFHKDNQPQGMNALEARCADTTFDKQRIENGWVLTPRHASTQEAAFPLFFFPGWHASAVEGKGEAAITSSEGFLAVENLSPPARQWRVWRERLEIERQGAWLSMLAFLLLGGGVVHVRKCCSR